LALNVSWYLGDIIMHNLGYNHKVFQNSFYCLQTLNVPLSCVLSVISMHINGKVDITIDMNSFNSPSLSLYIYIYLCCVNGEGGSSF
jgi:hypothetical protein